MQEICSKKKLTSQILGVADRVASQSSLMTPWPLQKSDSQV